MKIVVTGGAGFIGSNLIETLAGIPRVSEIVAVDDLSTGSLDNLLDLPVRLLTGTILDPDLLDEAVHGATSLVHLGALGSVPRSIDNPVSSHHANATGTLMVLEAARRHKVAQIILASSSSVYGANPTLPRRETLRPIPLSPYAVSKLATEAYANAYAACYGMSVLPFRFFNVFGPRQAADHAYAAVVPRFVSAALDGRPLQVHGDGTQTRDFTYVGSVISVISDAILRGVSAPDTVNLAFGARISLLELIAELEVVLGRRLEVVYGPSRAGDVRDSQADCERLRELFPAVNATSLVDGLRETVDWFRRARVPTAQWPAARARSA
ncbi:NAD-dependent epimerase/dehydratase family protein [Micromonospora noduli]|uniref:UDP-glucose 4-epimerase n=1 Tax=Micromonospora noduli TaxID=709876 RepID=A0A328N1H2_9ACTN|nr:NAD-dependent epimerase/dehydratase family protein [Micromonospora noduli]KAB1925306.1 NAD-dependent epimerase/dehydratase family protein [Micromonospora noduli]RAN99932.1 UDP-glucose 4-epimerase [Micromonospora noduli]RAO06724.1 UDP-glucose 4-epimerase [Micromonospora noduli]RAO10696.1 UDP-glucose 4-epimerase [Micromonospora noduli]RAO12023.1 UDP-glucose 4-epimerase [Micromonospora noduli]